MKRRFAVLPEKLRIEDGNVATIAWRVAILEGRNRVVCRQFWAGHSIPEKAEEAAARWNADPAMLEQTRNVRFWTWQKGWVKITLRPGQSLTTHRSYHNGEGWSWEAVTWTHDHETVTREWGSGGTDCDGRHSSCGKDCCPLDRLAAIESKVGYPQNEPPIYRPDWQDAEQWQRDYAAEAAGY